MSLTRTASKDKFLSKGEISRKARKGRKGKQKKRIRITRPIISHVVRTLRKTAARAANRRK